jgi:radical SAM/Cys-rich protein
MTVPAVKSIEPLNPFAAKLRDAGYSLRRRTIETLQVNLGRKCNQACRHCHVDAAPWRTETMAESTAHRIVDWIQRYRPPVVDITGGAPELSTFFKFIVENARRSGVRVIDRNNLTIIEEAGFADLPLYLAGWQVEIIASLPCYEPENVNKQRGAGVFKKSISALQKLNAAGYGTKLPLHLVYNPVGAQLPPSQEQLEKDYRTVLWDQFGIVFTSLYTITNQPIARFAEDLKRQGQWDIYSELLVKHFNPSTLEELMCRSTLSVGYDGLVYDCDFNQMLDLPLSGRSRAHLWEIEPDMLNGLEISTGAHCFACTAGAGSSCGGSLA